MGLVVKRKDYFYSGVIGAFLKETKNAHLCGLRLGLRRFICRAFSMGVGFVKPKLTRAGLAHGLFGIKALTLANYSLLFVINSAKEVTHSASTHCSDFYISAQSRDDLRSRRSGSMQASHVFDPRFDSRRAHYSTDNVIRLPPQTVLLA